MDETSRFDPNYEKSLQVVSSVDDETSLNLKADPATNRLLVNATLEDADIEIGAVEIKNATDNTRATVGVNGLHVDVQASALPTGAATSAKQLPNDHDVTVSNMIPAVETGLATSALQLADGHNVTVDNTSGAPVPITEVVGTGINGGDVAVGVAQVEITFTGITKAVMIQSKVANTGSIWVGLTGVTNVGANAFAQLSPGQSVSIELNDAAAAIFAISDVAAQTIYKVALT